MKKLVVNKEACIGCGACIAVDPEHFEFGDDGLSTVISNENTESANAVNALESCPTSAIKYEEGCGCGDGCTCGEECNCTPDHKCSPDCHCGE